MIEKTIAEFGRIDIVINNAGALWWQKVIDTPPKRFDLMMGVNVRAAYLTSHYALPHMVKQRWGHIINMCPPISTGPNPGHVCYMITKMGMARLAIGIAAEHHAGGIAANALWPRTIIESQASINWGMSTREQWRTPEIVCDATMAILAQEPPSYSGKQVIDEDVLSELAGITNFDHYWCGGGRRRRGRFISISRCGSRNVAMRFALMSIFDVCAWGQPARHSPGHRASLGPAQAAIGMARWERSEYALAHGASFAGVPYRWLGGEGGQFWLQPRFEGALVDGGRACCTQSAARIGRPT